MALLVAAIGIDGNGVKHPLGLIEGATENAAVVQALIDNLVARGLDPAVPRLFIIDGSKALSKAIRRPSGACAVITSRLRLHTFYGITRHKPSLSRHIAPRMTANINYQTAAKRTK
jgi:transposase-like protein